MRIDIEKAIVLLQQGEVVALPTETVYGLAAFATNPSAIAKIFAIKNRPADNPLICHFHSIGQVEEYVKGIPSTTRKLIDKFSPGPVSFMLDLMPGSPLKFATCGSEQVIARIPDHSIFLSILEKINVPLAAPSANTSGTISPTTAEMVEEDLGEKIAGIVDGGAAEVGLESTILDARDEKEILILRPGAVGENEIQEQLPGVKISRFLKENSMTTPGAKYRHYAPLKPVRVIAAADALPGESDGVLLATVEQMQSIPRGTIKNFNAKNIELLSFGSVIDLNELARNFYQRLAEADKLSQSKILLFPPSFGDSSLGKALTDRMRKIIGN
jgi:L-threonylcarbamoyladenylate synthase